MTWLCLIAAICLPSYPVQESSNGGSVGDTRDRYREILENYGIAGDAVGANEFLNSLLPDETTRSEIAGLIAKLASPTYLQRESAEKMLIARGPSALGQLRVAAKNGDVETRARSLRCIATIDATHERLVTTALEVLQLDTAKDPKPVERLDTVFRLLRKIKQHSNLLINAPHNFVDESCQQKIENGLRDSDRDIRISSALALPACFSKAELQRFTSLIETEDARVANAAIEVLGFLQPKRAANRLLKNLSDKDKLIREQSVSMLRTLSRQYFGLKADGALQGRRVASERWRSWIVDNSPLTAKHFENLASAIAAEPTGFLISVSGTSVHHVDLDGKQIWEHRVALYDSQYIDSNEVIVAERNRNLVRVIDRAGQTQLQIENVNSPSDVEMLINGNILVLSSAGKLFEFSDGKLLKTISGLDNPFDADRLPNGDTLVADSGNNRIVIFDPHGKVKWQKNQLKFPNNAHRLPDGRIAYTTYTSGDVVMLAADGTEMWRRNIPGSTLYSVYASASRVYVADGSNARIWVLNLDGSPIQDIDVARPFCDVDFITK